MKWIHPEQISVHGEAQDWEEAVRLAGELLVSGGMVEASYVEAMIETTRELGPYCVLAPGIAMPHARPDETVKQTGFSAVTLKQPVDFGNPDNDPVHLVIGLCALDHEAHIDALTKMAESISRPGFLEEVKQAKSVDELDGILNH